MTSVRLDPARIAQTFGASSRPGQSRSLHPSDPSASNYMYYEGRVLAFGRRYHFSLAHFNVQLVAGESRNQRDFGLLTIMPDYDALGRREAGR